MELRKELMRRGGSMQTLYTSHYKDLSTFMLNLLSIGFKKKDDTVMTRYILEWVKFSFAVFKFLKSSDYLTKILLEIFLEKKF